MLQGTVEDPTAVAADVNAQVGTDEGVGIWTNGGWRPCDCKLPEADNGEAKASKHCLSNGTPLRADNMLSW